MRQIADPEDVRVVVLYDPLPHEELCAEPAEGAPRPAWDPRRGGLSALLAAFAHRLCTPDSHAWAGNWTGRPDIGRLNAQGVLLLSARDLGFAGAVEYLCSRLGAARRRLIVLDTIEDWPADGPAVGDYHVYVRARLDPAAQCAVRWPECRELRAAVLDSSSIVGPACFARVEASFARLHPGAEPLRLCRQDNVRYTVSTRAGPRTPVPLPPRAYRQRVLPTVDGCKDMARQRSALGLGDPDFDAGAAFGHRAANRWGLGAPLRPVFVSCGRRGLAELRGPEGLPAELRAFCAAALLEPDAEAAPLVLAPGALAAAGAPPAVRWDFAPFETSVRAAGGAVETHRPSGARGPGEDGEDSAAVEIVGFRGGDGRPRGPLGPIKVEAISDDEEAEDAGNPYLLLR
ncbi:hypothetical protein EG877_15955 [Enterococcus faecalis]|nr:hypothetical protein EG877_15955 [Enterococcus faecalis]